jgi:hypothetical protein
MEKAEVSTLTAFSFRPKESQSSIHISSSGSDRFSDVIPSNASPIITLAKLARTTIRWPNSGTRERLKCALGSVGNSLGSAFREIYDSPINWADPGAVSFLCPTQRTDKQAVEQIAFATAGFYRRAPSVLYCRHGDREEASQARSAGGSPAAGRPLDRQYPELGRELATGGRMAEGDREMVGQSGRPICPSMPWINCRVRPKRPALRMPIGRCCG